MPETRPTWLLQAQKSSLQGAMSFGMYLGSWAPPWPPIPSFYVSIPAKISPRKGDFNLIFYAPKSYSHRDLAHRYPLVVNFHGGGMSIGTGTDDARWARDVLRELDAVFVSVEYRLAPEHAFPTAVQDSADAILYLVENAEELGLDPDRIALSGFSSGGNIVFTASILLEQLRRLEEKDGLIADGDLELEAPEPESSELDEFGVPISRLPAGYKIPPFTIKAILAWYPSVDFTQTRAQRAATNPRPDLAVSGGMGSMFDTGYIFNSHLSAYESAHPLLSPGTAPTELLDAALPKRIVIYTCEFDSLAKEGGVFAKRLEEELGRSVVHVSVEGVPHAWDKMPNPIWTPARIDELYKDACDAVKEWI